MMAVVPQLKSNLAIECFILSMLALISNSAANITKTLHQYFNVPVFGVKSILDVSDRP